MDMLISSWFAWPDARLAPCQIYERRNDALMIRTMNRPLPSGQLTLNQAKAFGVSATAAGVGLLATTVNPMTAALGLSNIVLYR